MCQQVPELVAMPDFPVSVSRSTGGPGWGAEGLFNFVPTLGAVRMDSCAVEGAISRPMDSIARQSFVAVRVRPGYP